MRRRSRRRRSDDAAPEVPLAPLIDMVFTILIFLLVSASFSRARGLPLDAPTSDAATRIDDDGFDVVVDANLALAADGRATTLDDLPERVRASGRSRLVVLTVDRSTPAGIVTDVYDAVLRGGADRVVLATEPRR
jgi:biopolymer transport protein ExbD